MPGLDQNPPSPGVGRTLAGRYRLVAPIARGGMAEVWEGYDEVLSRPVAVKILQAHLAADGVFLERFRREAITAARLAHPGITATFDTGVDRGTAFIVMELVRGRNLRQMLDDWGRLEPWQAVTISRQVADALAYAHQAGLVHRDIKPANVLIVEEEWGGLRVKVTDFGIAKAGMETGADLTRTGMVLGTPKYLSPEQIRGIDPDARADLYSLGVVLYEMLVGAPPFVGETDMATALAHLSDKPPRPSSSVRHLPSGLDRIVGDLLAKAPDRRIQSAADLRGRLDALGPLGPPPGRSEPGRRGRWRGDHGGPAGGRDPGRPTGGGPPPMAPTPYRAPGHPAAPGPRPGPDPAPAGAVTGRSPVTAPSGPVASGAAPAGAVPAAASSSGGTQSAPSTFVPAGPVTSGPGGRSGGFPVPPPPPPPGWPPAGAPPGRGSAPTTAVEGAPTTAFPSAVGGATTSLPGVGATSALPGIGATTAFPYRTGPGTDEFGSPPPPPPVRRHRRSERNAGLVVLGLVVAGAIVAAVLLSGTGHARSGAGGPLDPSAPPVAIGSVAVYMVNGRPPDNPGATHFTFDGNPATYWSTDIYPDPTFGNLYPGIGLEISLDHSATLGSLTVSSPSQGWSASAYVSGSAVPSPSPISAWGAPTDTKSGIAGGTTLSLGGHKGSYVLLWITNLGPSHQVKIGDLTVR